MKKNRGTKRSLKGGSSKKSRRKISKSYRRRASKVNRRNRISRKNKSFRNKRKIRKNIRRKATRKRKQRGGAFFLTGAVHRLPFGKYMADGFFKTETGAYNLVDNMAGHPTTMSPTPTAQPLDH